MNTKEKEYEINFIIKTDRLNESESDDLFIILMKCARLLFYEYDGVYYYRQRNLVFFKIRSEKSKKRIQENCEYIIKSAYKLFGLVTLDCFAQDLITIKIKTTKKPHIK